MLSFISFALFTVFTTTSSSESKAGLVRRLNIDETPTKMPTASPISPTASPTSPCKETLSGATSPIANPSQTSMALVYLGTSQKHEIDLDMSISLNANDAKAFCQSNFGTNSVPVTPTTPNTFTAMVNLCESLGNGQTCYMGLYRKDYDGARGDCVTWRGEDNAFTTDSTDIDTNYGNWAGSQPSCLWNGDLHCIAYKTTSNKLKVVDCTDKMHVICTYNGQCNA